MRKRAKILLIAFFPFAIAFVSFVGRAYAFGSPLPIQFIYKCNASLTLCTGSNSDVDISGNLVVWVDTRNSSNDPSSSLYANTDIYLYDLNDPGAGPRQITAHPSWQGEPSISGNIITWTDRRNADDDIYFCIWNTATKTCPEQRIALPGRDDMLPAVSDRGVVWESYWSDLNKPDDGDIYFYNFATRSIKVIASTNLYEEYPVISGGKMAWTADPDNYNMPLKIFLYDLDKPQAGNIEVARAKADEDGDFTDPVLGNISGNYLIYEDNNIDPNSIYISDIWLYDITQKSKRIVAQSEGGIYDVWISGNRIIYDDDRKSYDADGRTIDDRTDLFLKDITTGSEYLLTPNGGHHLAWAISDAGALGDNNPSNDPYEALFNRVFSLYNFRPVSNVDAKAFRSFNTTQLYDGAITVAYNEPFGIQWGSTNADICKLSGTVATTYDNRELPPSGIISLLSQRVPSATYSVTCSNVYSSVSDTIGVTTFRVDITANNSDGPLPVSTNSRVALSWSSSGVNTCTASGGWSGSLALSGSVFSPVITDDTIFAITCNGPGGSTSDSVRVIPAPYISIKTDTPSIPAFSDPTKKTVTINWLAKNATSCSAWGAWSGSKPASGSYTTSVLVPRSTFYDLSYNLMCTGLGGTVTRVVTVRVLPYPYVDLKGSAGGESFFADGPIITGNNKPAYLKWTAVNVGACNASGSWVGGQAIPSGQYTTQNLSTGSRSFTLTCTGSPTSSTGTSGTTADSVVVNTNSPPGTQLPDFVMGPWFIGFNRQVGATTTMTMVVTNMGGMTSNSAFMQFKIDSETIPQTSYVIPSLPPGTPIVIAREFFPMAGRTYTVTAKADYYNQVYESNESNNTKTFSFTVPPPSLASPDSSFFNVLSARVSSGALVINGSSNNFSALIANATGITYGNINYQFWVEQGSTRRAAGGLSPLCAKGLALGVVPSGDCYVTLPFTVKDTGITAGTGTFVPGPATLVADLGQLYGPLIKENRIPIMLVSSNTLASGMAPQQKNISADSLANILTALQNLTMQLQKFLGLR